MTRNPISVGSPWEASFASLALLRIWTAVVVLGAADVWHAPLQIPRSVDVQPLAGAWGAVLAVLPRTTPFLQGALAVTVLGAAATAVGVRTRLAAAVLALGLFVLLGLAQLWPTPIHNHHLVWFAALLAASPCGESLSVDAWLRKRRQRAAGRAAAPHAASAAAGFTLWFASALLAAVYFFPGVHKALDVGTPFFDSAALQRLLQLKAFEAGASVPSVLADHPQGVLWCAGAVVVVEVCFVVLALRARWRRACVVVMLALHAGLALSVFIGFSVLAVFAIVFALPVRRTTASASTRGVAAVGLVGGVLLAGVALAGTQGTMRGFPFACYPTFAKGPRMGMSIERGPNCWIATPV